MSVDPAPRPVLVLGMGNILLTDEGLGVRALEAFCARYEVPEDVELLDGGTTGMGLLDDIGGRTHLLVLDAVQTGAPPGTLAVLRGEEIPVYFGRRGTPHQLGLSDVLATLELAGEKPAHVTVLGIVPDSLELSDTIAAQLDGLVDALVTELAALGHPPRLLH